MDDGPALQVEGLRKDYGGVGVFDLDLRVERGTVHGFLGPNGSGKSTTIRMVMGLAVPDAGRVRVLGADPRRDGPAVRARTGFLPAELSLWRRATPRTVLTHLARLRGGADQRRTADLCDRFGVELDRPVRTLSTGNKQKVGLVQAFMHDPELVVLDEPTTGLDPLVQQEFQALVRETAAAGRTVFLSSHTLSEVERVADRVAVLREGRLVAEESVSALKRLAVRRVRVELDRPAERADLAGVPGLDDLVVDGRTLSATVAGPVDALVKALARTPVLALTVEDGELEDVFLRLYDSEHLAPAPGGTR